jgi:5-aminolevulinate synthase
MEREIAQLHGKQDALVFTSGYVFNETGIAIIAKLTPNCVILSDAPLIEGVRRSGSEKKIWRHNDTAHVEALLAAAPERPKLIVFQAASQWMATSRR